MVSAFFLHQDKHLNSTIATSHISHFVIYFPRLFVLFYFVSWKLGLQSQSLFITSDLHSKKFWPGVLQNLTALSRSFFFFFSILLVLLVFFLRNKTNCFIDLFSVLLIISSLFVLKTGKQVRISGFQVL